MDEIFAVSLTAMQADGAALDRIALNLANVQTPGYKRVAVARSFDAAMHASKPSSPLATQPSEWRETRDVRAGTIKVTGNALDVALASDGYFEVLTPSGLAYTRAGNFTLDTAGRLVTVQGHLVMGTGGELRPGTRSPVIDAAGRITEATDSGREPRPVGQLKIVRFANAQQLRSLGDNLLGAGGDLKVLAEGDIQLRQGALENANVNPGQEMVDLSRTVRRYESVQRALQGYDDMVGNAIRRFAEN